MSSLLKKAGLALVGLLLFVTVYRAVRSEVPASPETLAQQVISFAQADKNSAQNLATEHSGTDENDENADSDNYISVEEASELLRDALLSREQSFEVNVISDLNLFDDDVFRARLYEPAFSEELSGESPFAGEFLHRNVSGGSYRLRSDDKRHWKVEFLNFTYTVSPQQSDEFEKRVYDVVCGMGIRNQSDYNKCLAIYNYITTNVRYDYDTLELYREGESTGRELGYTAYAALVQGRAVCAGYAQLFYVMCRAVDLPVRIIRGEAYSMDTWDGHSWNAVEIEGTWYQVDCTWDEGLTMDQWAFFLKGTDFPRHKVTSGMPAGVLISDGDYTPQKSSLSM